MNNTVVTYLRNLLERTSGNYFELGSEGGELISVLSTDHIEKMFISVDADSNNYNHTMKMILNRANVLFYSMSAAEYNQTLTDSVAQSHAVSVIFINHGVDYVDYAEAIKVSQRLLGTKPGHILINGVSTIPNIIEEFQNLLGYRITRQTEIASDLVDYQIREQ